MKEKPFVYMSTQNIERCCEWAYYNSGDELARWYDRALHARGATSELDAARFGKVTAKIYGRSLRAYQIDAENTCAKLRDAIGRVILARIKRDSWTPPKPPPHQLRELVKAPPALTDAEMDTDEYRAKLLRERSI